MCKNPQEQPLDHKEQVLSGALIIMLTLYYIPLNTEDFGCVNGMNSTGCLEQDKQEV